jgi:glycosyltransferase involved in cell wall biosynthesis
MRIGVISYDYSPPIGGLGVMVQNLLKECRKKNLCTFITLSPSPSADDQVSSLAAKRWNKKGGCPLFSILLNWNLKRLIHQYSLDILHVHAGSGGVFLGRKPLIPLIVTAHHTYEQERQYVFQKWTIPWCTKWLMSQFEARTYRLADRITCVSEDTRQALINDYRIDPKKISVIENALEESLFVPCLPKRSLSIRHFLFLGRLEERKGIWTLLHAFSHSVKTYPDLVLLLAGKNLLGDEIHRWIQENNCTKNVFILDAVSEEKKKELLDTSDVLIVPSILEGFGLIAGEGMARGIPIIAADCPGIRAIIRHNETGLLFESKNSDDLARVLQNVLRDGISPSIAERAFEEAKERFSVKRQADAYMVLYKAVSDERIADSA